ncbi:MAG: M48 family metallopeptidase [Hyphomonas sp.]|uniref:M48 family metallopeptidase n=1 Tax=Hyphomonas sp. TaxID=87 RepID=UPI0017C99ECF|nr:M48 family metallopeptidase [Hyphomonas sp.]MBU3921265.1 M48 family metallopeptidase [Alphaproteobacteria bacterium]MBA3066865.1 M48 family metallopeptidase [Hyphomonas sp.]MBU4060944.1 M48 family metallopeptidase [Alphaproteobacteria bacterium]MBU4166152.1 M48 family metallopeptidase [Alphaproteobacteria bacterium]MBU4569611.1 M48 family metallopeptidase [Alphaproteobacteria bacterium]
MNREADRICANGLGDILRSRFGILLVALAGIFLYWQMNQKDVPFAPGKKQLNTISVAREIQLGQDSYLQILQQEQSQGNAVLCADPAACTGDARALTDTVRDIGKRLEAAALELEDEYRAQGYDMPGVVEQFDWTYYVVDSATPNAFCLPGGYVAVYTGILDITGNYDDRVSLEDVRDTNKLAVVMGHEIGHALAHHGAARMSTQQVLQVGQMAVAVGLGDMSAGQQRAVMEAFGVAAQGGFLAFSREHETQADKIGLDLLVRACYDPREAPELWERMGEIGGGERPPEWMSTHPASETRAGNFRKWMPDAIAQYEARCGPLR